MVLEKPHLLTYSLLASLMCCIRNGHRAKHIIVAPFSILKQSKIIMTLIIAILHGTLSKHNAEELKRARVLGPVRVPSATLHPFNSQLACTSIANL